MDFLNLTNRIKHNDLDEYEKREAASYISAYLRHQGTYATITEIYRYLNNEIEFNQIRDRLQEAYDSKNQEKAIKILNDIIL